MFSFRTQSNCSKFRAVLSCAALAVCFFVAGTSSAQEAHNILYFGNSFTNATCCGGTQSVPNILRDIAVAAGQPEPQQRNASANGQSLQWHLDNNTSRIDIPGGQTWDFVVLQDFSTGPTHIGNLSQHLSSSLELYQAVASHSPDVVPIMYETWARGPGHPFYTGANPTFPGGPAQMQQEVRDGYHLSTENINTTIGSELARYAPVGDAWEDTGFNLDLYAGDIYHAQNRGSLLNALVLYGTIYEDTSTSDIDLSGILSSLNISAADGAYLAGIADGVLAAPVPEPASLLVATLGLMCLAAKRNRAA